MTNDSGAGTGGGESEAGEPTGGEVTVYGERLHFDGFSDGHNRWSSRGSDAWILVTEDTADHGESRWWVQIAGHGGVGPDVREAAVEAGRAALAALERIEGLEPTIRRMLGAERSTPHPAQGAADSAGYIRGTQAAQDAIRAAISPWMQVAEDANLGREIASRLAGWRVPNDSPSLTEGQIKAIARAAAEVATDAHRETESAVRFARRADRADAEAAFTEAAMAITDPRTLTVDQIRQGMDAFRAGLDRRGVR